MPVDRFSNGDVLPSEEAVPSSGGVQLRRYSAGELAVMYGRSTRTIRGWMKDGKLPFHLVGNTRFVRSEDLE